MTYPRLLASVASLLIAAGGAAYASPLYFQGFETDVSGWTPDTGGSPPGTITRTASGGGSLGLTAYDGTHYAEVTNSPNAYQPGYGTGGFTFFGNTSGGPLPYPGSPFTQSVALYVNEATPAPTNPGAPAFWIDAAPSSTSPSDAPGGIGLGGEQSFQLYYSGTSTSVGFTGAAPSLSLAHSGWYVFQFLYARGPTPTSLSTTTLTVFDGAATLGSVTLPNGNNSDPLESQFLAGPGYLWLPVWQNGFSNDTLGIDDVRADASVPEPSSLALLGAGLFVTLLYRRRQLRS